MPRKTKENVLNRKSNVFGSNEYGIYLTRQNTLRCVQWRRYRHNGNGKDDDSVNWISLQHRRHCDVDIIGFCNGNWI